MKYLKEIHTDILLLSNKMYRSDARSKRLFLFFNEMDSNVFILYSSLCRGAGILWIRHRAPVSSPVFLPEWG